MVRRPNPSISQNHQEKTQSKNTVFKMMPSEKCDKCDLICYHLKSISHLPVKRIVRYNNWDSKLGTQGQECEIKITFLLCYRTL